MFKYFTILRSELLFNVSLLPATLYHNRNVPALIYLDMYLSGIYMYIIIYYNMYMYTCITGNS